jgi:hypothetical protein
MTHSGVRPPVRGRAAAVVICLTAVMLIALPPSVGGVGSDEYFAK